MDKERLAALLEGMLELIDEMTQELHGVKVEENKVVVPFIPQISQDRLETEKQFLNAKPLATSTIYENGKQITQEEYDF